MAFKQNSSPFQRTKKAQLGMTLIEIMIAILILGVMSALTYFSIQRSSKIKVKVEKEIEDDAQLREAVAIMTKDLNLAFKWTDINELIKKQISNEAKEQNKPDPIPTPQFNNTIPVDKLTAFVGDSQSIYFSTLSHERIMKDAPESDQAKVGYYLKQVNSFKTKKPTQALFRSSSPYLDDDITKTGKEALLLENIKTLKLRYLPDDAKEITDSSWIESWKSTEGLDEKTKSKFPIAVEINITTEHDGRVSQIKTIAGLHMIRNEPYTFATAPAATPTPNGQNSGGKK